MKKAKKNVASILTMILSLTLVLSACSSSNNGGNKENSSNAGKETSAASAEPSAAADQKEVVLKGYLLGDAPKGMPEVLTQLNEKLKKDINATIELNYIGWGDVQSKYPLILASGEDVDFVFSADWNYYVQQATKGAFYELKMEDIQKYMPLKTAKLDPAAWDATKINGQMFMIPSSTPDRKVSVAVLRKDIMAEAGLTEVKRFSEIGPYLAAAKKNHPDMIGLNLDSQFDLPTPYQYLLRDKIGYQGAPIDSGNPMAQGVAYDFEDPTGKLYSMVEEPYLSAQKYAAGIMKDWYDKGYINKNPYSNKIRSKDNFVEGKSAVALGNTNDVASVMEAAAAKGIETYVVSALTADGKAPQSTWTNNGISIAANSKNPERVMQAIDLIMEDPSYVYLTYFGVEGTNYAITADDKIGLPEGITSETNTYPPDAAGFWFVNKDLFKPMSNWPQSYIDHQEKVKDYLTDFTYNGFTFNSDKVKTQISNLANASTQYANPIYIGVIKDVDKAFDELAKNLNSAGLDKVKAEVQAQADVYLASKK
ncbi:DUF3502 domain-containing protein [Paenibacillus sp. 19GGS1-52]|uniref:DUF3502 domain-containing protein n=1 Tax=Paenibacillus sp. 19GGS1-52 TaxID=2758563 RepID=UPI001EFC21EE|nr:DUF3502 domain-containing protein [Paenibacillus sp. 19GGS1-52]ULO09805.1 DUF3502 domain-containing protein [Paenibacillus sp. 19GGS1-52]